MGCVRHQSASLATQKVTVTGKKEETQNHHVDRGSVLPASLSLQRAPRGRTPAQAWSPPSSSQRLTPPSAQHFSALPRPRSEPCKRHCNHFTADSSKPLRRGNTSLTLIKRNPSCTKDISMAPLTTLKNNPRTCNKLPGSRGIKTKG